MLWYNYLNETQCLQTNEMQHHLGKESALGTGGGVERVVLIKSLIYARKKECAYSTGFPSSAENVS